MQPSWSNLYPAWDLPQKIPAILADVLALQPADDDERAFAAMIEAAPKIELHVHMEAAVPAAFYAGLNNERQLFAPHDLPQRRAPYPSLKEFIAAWVDQTRLIEDPALFERLAHAFIAQRRKQNIVYSEVHISPIDFSLVRDRFQVPAKVLAFADCLDAYVRGLASALRGTPGVEARLIVDALWVSTDEECRIMLAALEKHLASPFARDEQGQPYVIAIGMGGPEVASFGPKKTWFVQACRALGLKIDVHTGENTSPADHRLGLETIKPDRIGHGISGAKDKTPWFFDGPIAANPTSNLITGSFQGKLADHPITLMRKRGGLVSINTDDPLLFGVPLTLEWVALRRALGWGSADFADLRSQAVRSALTPSVLSRVYTD